MSVGLYDFDFSQKISNNFFNLELMKLSAFYKKKREIVILSPSYTPERYSKYIVRKDDLTKVFPAHLLRHKNLEYGGRGFSSGRYIPLPEEVELMKADTSIYESFDEVKKWKNSARSIFHTLYNGCHFRLSLDEKTIWSKYSSQLYDGSRSYLIVHDSNIGKINGAASVLKTLCYYHNEPRRIVFRYPIRTESFEDLKLLFELQIAPWSGIIEKESPFGLENIHELVERRPPINRFRIVKMVPLWANTETFFTEILPSYYDEAIYLTQKGFTYSIDYSNVIFDKPFLKNFCTMLAQFFNYRITDDKTEKSFGQYMIMRGKQEKKHPIMTKTLMEDTRKAFRYCYDINYDFFKKMYQLYGFEEGETLNEKWRANCGGD